ncbi:MAG: lactonase family protein [Candidatus Hydrogenedentes bacterium]|nr:lactonase family protein [Candidatus Hydrogenedentota bacterium]
MLTTQLIAIALIPMAAAAAPADQTNTAQPAGSPVSRIYVGSAKAIFLVNFDPATGRLEDRGVVCETEDPSFLALHPTMPVLYAVGEAKEGFVASFRMDAKSGLLSLLNRQPSKGGGPCHVSVAPSGRHVAVANYGSGSVALLPVLDDGRLGEASGFFQHQGSSANPQRQTGPHAHGVTFDIAGRFLFAPDLGIDKVCAYRYDENARELPPNDPAFASLAPGAGPRHIAFHPSGRFAYVVNEMGNTVSAFTYDAEKGRLAPLQITGTLPESFKGDSTTAEIVAHPSGHFLYASNRGHDSITTFSVNPETGTLTRAGDTPTGGRTPRSFAVDPSGKYLLAANQGSGDIILFKIDPNNGALQSANQRVRVPSPACVIFARP